MKRLSINIEDIHIKGGPFQLTEVITSIDNSLQKLSQATDDITSLVIKYSSSNKGHQYQKMVTTLVNLNNRLYEASVEINNMQNEIVNYQNKVLRYEGQFQSVTLPNKIIINKSSIDVDTNDIKFELIEMIGIKTELTNYSGLVYTEMKNIVTAKTEIGQIWLDTQYRDFAEFIDSLNMDAINSLREFGEYIVYLDGQIKELSQ